MLDLLFTGANGQLGWEISRRAKGPRVHALDRSTLDITDRSAVMETVGTLKPQVVINAAAYTAVDKAESDRDAALAVNRDGPAHLAEACAAHGAMLLHVSTDYVFDGRKDGAYDETDPVAPLGVYGESKLAGEEVIRQRTPRHVILRTAWVHGIHGGNFVKTMLRLGAEREVLRVVDDQRGSPTFAGDLAEAALSIARSLSEGTMPETGFGTFHCVGGGETTWCGFAREIFRLGASRLARVPRVEAISTADFPTPARRPANSVLDTTRLQQIHRIHPRPWNLALAEGLAVLLGEEQDRT
jgi:dTDP-4-dehydrorhamnose reductase